MGLEPMTPSLKAMCSNLLSYGPSSHIDLLTRNKIDILLLRCTVGCSSQTKNLARKYFLFALAAVIATSRTNISFCICYCQRSILYSR